MAGAGAMRVNMAHFSTNPLVADSDHDGIADGYELQNLSMLGIPQENCSATRRTGLQGTI